MRLTIDFETRSACDIKKHGAWVYSEHPTTEVLCLALLPYDPDAPPDEDGVTYITDIFKYEDIRDPRRIPDIEWYLDQPDEIEAHNMSFEYAIWTNIMVKRHGWPPLPIDKLRCSAAKASMHSLPRSLDGACQALGLPIQKDMEGYRLMMKMCRPRPNKGQGLLWQDDPNDLERLYQYCMRDVEAEEALSNALRDLPEQELKVWQLDQVINARGIQADLDACQAMLEMVQEHEAGLLEELKTLTNGAVKTAKQVEQLRGYLRGLGVDLPDLSSATVKEALSGSINGTARDILRIRKSLGRSSSAKYQSIIDRSSSDGRVRGALLYHGAATGRWSGAGIQPQNFPSRIKITEDPEVMLDTILAGGLDLHNALFPDDPMATAGAVTRSVLVSKPGHELVVADYSAIEGRGLAWLAGEDTELQAYQEGLDVYIANAAKILGKPYEAITKDERQSPGKISVLACGYQGGAGAVRKFGGEGMTDDEITEKIVRPWRDAHPATTAFWRGLEEACMSAVRDPGRGYYCRAIGFRVQDNFLVCRLPSGRLLYYYDPKVIPTKTSWGDIKECVTYMTVDSMTKKWVRTNTYGGKLAENVTQAICRDLMAEAMLRIEEAGYPIVLTVHDELVCEVPEGFGSVEEFCEIMCKVPAWAKGFPIKAEGWRGKRYRK